MDIIAQYYFQYKIWRSKWQDARKKKLYQVAEICAQNAWEYRKAYLSAKSALIEQPRHDEMEKRLLFAGYTKLAGTGGSTGLEWNAWEKWTNGGMHYIVLPVQHHSSYDELVNNIINRYKV